jgi:hypothetical protein
MRGARLLSLICILLLAGCRLGDPVSFFNEDKAVEQAFTTLKERMGNGKVRALSITIEPDKVTLRAQDPKDTRNVDEWRVSRVSMAGISWERQSGPDPVKLDLINPRLEDNLFDLDSVVIAAANNLARASIERAKLEDAARISRMEIVRQVYIIPAPASGPVRWSVSVTSDRESAQIFADAKGAITRVDLTNTNRAKNLDLLQELDHTAEAGRAFRTALGEGPVLLKIGISSKSVGFETNRVDKSFPMQLSGSLSAREVYSWNLNGLARSMGSVNADVALANAPHAPFGVEEIDWTVLPKLVAAAKDQLGMPNGRITDLGLSKPTDGAGQPVLLWKVEITDANREHGYVLADIKGVIKQTMLPESRRKPTDWYDPAAMAGAITRMTREFGPAARFVDLTFMNDKVVITVQDPRKPDDYAQMLLTDAGFTRFGTPSMFAVRNPPFTMADLAPLDARKLADLQAATLEKLGMQPNAIAGVTISRGSMDPSPKGNVTIEIRAEERVFGRGGRVNYEMDGTVLKAYLP